MKPGSRLKNKSILVIKSEEREDDKSSIVLAIDKAGSYPYVVWLMNEAGHTLSGHYHKTLKEAQKTYKERCEIIGVNY